MSLQTDRLGALALAALLALSPARAQGGAPQTLQTKLSDYCVLEGLSACGQGVFWEVKAQCPTPKKIVAVSCAINNFNYGATLVENAPDGAVGRCVWRLGWVPDSTTLGTISLLCGR